MRQKHNNLNNKNNKHITYMKLFFVFLIIVLVFVLGYVILKKTSLWEKVNSVEKIRKIVEGGGVFSFLIFIFLQILQTTILQIPSILITLAGLLVFGKLKAFVLSFIAIMIGSIIMFWIGRKCGRKFINFLVSEENANKWVQKMSNGKYLFFLMMIFPLFPDDILCAVAGVTDMTFKFFFWTNVIARAIGISCVVFFGSGAIIPFTGFGLLIWGFVAVLIVLLFYVSIKYKNKIDDIIKSFNKKK